MKPVSSRPSWYANPGCSATRIAASATAFAAARAWSKATSGEELLIQIQASCWVAGAPRPSGAVMAWNRSSEAGASAGATSRQASAPNATTRFTPPAETSDVRSLRNEATAAVGVTSGRRSNSRKWCAWVP